MRVASSSNLPPQNPGIIGNRPIQNSAGSGQRTQSQMYMNSSGNIPSSTTAEETEDVVRSFRTMSLQTPNFNQPPQPSPLLSTQSSAPGGVALGQHVPYMLNGQIMFSQQPYYHHNGNSAMYAAAGSSMMNHSGYNTDSNGGGQPHFTSNHSPPSWQSSRIPSSQIQPSLVTPRRSSGGSSGDHDGPGTPFTQYTNYGGGVPLFDHSPNSLYAWSTPSPSQPRYYNKPQQQIQIPLELQILCQQDPPIPKAVPAPFSPTKPLDRRLENPNGITSE